jgi:hypothetical protein
VKFQERDLDPVVAGDAKNNDRCAQRRSSRGTQRPPRESLHQVTSVCRSTDLTISEACGWGGSSNSVAQGVPNLAANIARVIY